MPNTQWGPLIAGPQLIGQPLSLAPPAVNAPSPNIRSLLPHIPLPISDPRGPSFNYRLPGDLDENGYYLPADAFMRHRGQTTLDQVYSPDDIIRRMLNGPSSIWGPNIQGT